MQVAVCFGQMSLTHFLDLGCGLVPRKCFFADEHSYNFYPAPVNLGIDREGTAKSQDGQQKGTLAHAKRKVATALSMKVKPVKKYRHSCAFAPISAVEACLENSPSSLHFLFCCNFYSLKAALKPALKPAAIFFSVQRRMASARSFNMFQSMLQMGLID